MSVAFSGNDNFANAFVLPSNDNQATGSTTGYTTETGEPDHGSYGYGATAWFKFTAPSDSKYQISSQGSDFDTVLAVYTSSNPSAPDFTNLTEIAFNDDSGSASTSSVEVSLTAGEVIYIQIGGWSSATGNLVVTYAPPPPNDNFVDRQVLAQGSTSVDGTTLGATMETGEYNPSSVVSSVWYTWYPASGVDYTQTANWPVFGISACSFSDAGIAVYVGDGTETDVSTLTENNWGGTGAGSSVQTQGDVTGKVVYLQVGGSSGGSGTFTMTYPAAGGPPVHITVTNPGPQLSQQSTAPTPLQIVATDDLTGATMSYSATGLPDGLTIDSATGQITGTPTTIGSWRPTVTVTDDAGGGSASTTFGWNVVALVPTGAHLLGATIDPTTFINFQGNFNVDAFALDDTYVAAVMWTRSGTQVQIHVQILDCSGDVPVLAAEQAMTTIYDMANQGATGNLYEIDAGMGAGQSGSGLACCVIYPTGNGPTDGGYMGVVPISFSGGTLTVGTLSLPHSWSATQVGPPALCCTPTAGEYMAVVPVTGIMHLDHLVVAGDGTVSSDWGINPSLPHTTGYFAPAEIAPLGTHYLATCSDGYLIVDWGGSVNGITIVSGPTARPSAISSYQGIGEYATLIADKTFGGALWVRSGRVYFLADGTLLDTITAPSADAYAREMVDGSWIEGFSVSTGSPRSKLHITVDGTEISGSPVSTDDLNNDDYTPDRAVLVGRKYLMIANQGSPWDYTYAYLLQIEPTPAPAGHLQTVGDHFNTGMLKSRIAGQWVAAQ